MLLTQLEYFVALAREEHFGRAAASCFVSPSTLSEAIRKLETEMGAPLVQRGHAFEGLTAEGQRVLHWARRILADHRALVAEVAAVQETLSGSIRIGAIPAAMAGVTGVLAHLLDAHPGLRVRSESNLTSEQIADRLRRYELDAGLLHPTGLAVSDLAILPLYRERLVVVAGPGIPLDEQVTAAVAATLPLCLLEPGMGARRILDTALAEHDVVLRARVETDSLEELVALVGRGSWASIVPESFVAASSDALTVRPLVAPEVDIAIAVATLAEDPPSAFSRAVTAAAHACRTELVRAERPRSLDAGAPRRAPSSATPGTPRSSG